MSDCDKGVRHNEGKVPLELVPASLMFAVGEVLQFGVQKYKTENWRKGLSWKETTGSLMRHLFKWSSPFHDDIDEESGLNHLWHVACNVAMLIEYENTCQIYDDRFKYDKKQSL